jgi:hypothetical protein
MQSTPSAAFMHRDAPQSAHPQPGLAIQMQVNHTWTRQFGRIPRVENRKFHPIEPHQPIESPEPKIPVGRLDHGGRGILGQTILRLPRLNDEGGRRSSLRPCRRCGERYREQAAGNSERQESRRHSKLVVAPDRTHTVPSVPGYFHHESDKIRPVHQQYSREPRTRRSSLSAQDAEQLGPEQDRPDAKSRSPHLVGVENRIWPTARRRGIRRSGCP